MDAGIYYFINQGCLTVDNMDDKAEMQCVEVNHVSPFYTGEFYRYMYRKKRIFPAENRRSPIPVVNGPPRGRAILFCYSFFGGPGRAVGLAVCVSVSLCNF